MSLSLIEKGLNEDNYEEYVDKIINIFRLSSKESSILFNIEIKDYKALIQLSIVSSTGEKKSFTDTVFKCDNAFYRVFLTKLVEAINGYIDIITKDIVSSEETDLVTFRMITKNNDLLTIDGLSQDDANRLLSIVNEEDYVSKDNLIIVDNKGIGSVTMFLLMIGVILTAFILVVWIMG